MGICWAPAKKVLLASVFAESAAEQVSEPAASENAEPAPSAQAEATEPRA